MTIDHASASLATTTLFADAVGSRCRSSFSAAFTSGPVTAVPAIGIPTAAAVRGIIFLTLAAASLFPDSVS